MIHMEATISAPAQRIEMAKSLIDSRNNFIDQYKRMIDLEMSEESLSNYRGLIKAYESFLDSIAVDFGASWTNSTEDNIAFLSQITEADLARESWTMEGTQNYSSDFNWTNEPNYIVYASTIYQKVCGLHTWQQYNDHSGNLRRMAIFDHEPSKSEIESYFMTPKQYEYNA